jgi:aminocarboxymuconate-semialdehyde decarboxylase
VTAGRAGLLRAIDSLGADRLLLRTDLPYENGEVFLRAVYYVTDLQIAPSTATAILDQNACAPLGVG